MKKYTYFFIDKAVLSPYIQKILLLPIAKRLPSFVLPNHITYFSLFFSTAALLSAILLPSTASSLLLTSLLLLIYQAGDHLDGFFARYKSLSTPKGEFLDHFHDIYGNGVIAFMTIKYFEITNIYLVIAIFAFHFLIQATKFQFQHKYEYMLFDKLGPAEAVFMLLALLFGYRIPFFYDVLNILFRDVRIVDLILAGIFSLGFFSLFFRELKDGHYCQRGLLYLTASLSFFYTLSEASFPLISAIIIPFNLLFIGNIIYTRLKDNHYPFSDFVAPLLLLIGKLIGIAPFLLFSLAISYLIAKSIDLYLHALSRLE